MVSMLVGDYLEELGCEVIGVASRLEDTVEIARTLPLDAAVLDMSLPRRLSYPVAQASHARGVPMVFTTRYDTEGLPAGLQKAATLSNANWHLL
jgi:DNA-binding NarL/FixJ family response regulator